MSEALKFRCAYVLKFYWQYKYIYLLMVAGHFLACLILLTLSNAQQGLKHSSEANLLLGLFVLSLVICLVFANRIFGSALTQLDAETMTRHSLWLTKLITNIGTAKKGWLIIGVQAVGEPTLAIKSILRDGAEGWYCYLHVNHNHSDYPILREFLLKEGDSMHIKLNLRPVDGNNLTSIICRERSYFLEVELPEFEGFTFGTEGEPTGASQVLQYV